MARPLPQSLRSPRSLDDRSLDDGPAARRPGAVIARCRSRLDDLFERFDLDAEEAAGVAEQAFLELRRHGGSIQRPEAWLLDTVEALCRARAPRPAGGRASGEDR